MDMHDEVLIALRQIIRSTELYSKKIKKEYGLTSPQLLLLRAIEQTEGMTIRQLSDTANMSQATATSILDRLEAGGLIIRVRDTQDKRKVHANLTDKGHTILKAAPQMMQHDVITQFDQLENWEQSLILSSVQRLASMMNDAQTPSDINAKSEIPPDSDSMLL